MYLFLASLITHRLTSIYFIYLLIFHISPPFSYKLISTLIYILTYLWLSWDIRSTFVFANLLPYCVWGCVYISVCMCVFVFVCICVCVFVYIFISYSFIYCFHISFLISLIVYFTIMPYILVLYSSVSISDLKTWWLCTLDTV